MSYQEKRTVVSLVTGTLIMTAYCVYVFGRYRSGAVELSNLSFFAVAMLVYIGIGIAATIVIQIVFHILLSVAIAVKERSCDDKEIEKAVKAAVVEDEMDKLIELKSDRLVCVFAGLGFIGGLITLAFNYPPAVMLNILFLSGGVGTLAGGISSIYYYRAGVR